VDLEFPFGSVTVVAKFAAGDHVWVRPGAVGSKAMGVPRGGLVPGDGERAAQQHGPGRARAQAQQRVPASMLDMLMNLLPSSSFRSYMCDKSN